MTPAKGLPDGPGCPARGPPCRMLDAWQAAGPVVGRGSAVQVPGFRPNHAKKGPLRKSDHRIVQNVAPRGLPRPEKTRNDYPPSRAFTVENVARMIINRGRSGTESLRKGGLLLGETFRKYYNLPPPHEFINKSVLDTLCEIRKSGLTPDTVIFCESVEHIPGKEFFAAFEIIKNMLTVTSGLMIITNWIYFHPIQKNRNMDWNHITTIDDAVYDSLAAQAKSVVFRQGSHLVLQF